MPPLRRWRDGVRSVEWIKNEGQVLRRNAWAGIAHDNRHAIRSLVNRHHNLSPVCVGKHVLKQVEHNLGKGVSVGRHLCPLWPLQTQENPLGVGLFLSHVRQRVQQGRYVRGAALRRQRSAVGTGEHEQAAD